MFAEIPVCSRPAPTPVAHFELTRLPGGTYRAHGSCIDNEGRPHTVNGQVFASAVGALASAYRELADLVEL